MEYFRQLGLQLIRMIFRWLCYRVGAINTYIRAVTKFEKNTVVDIIWRVGNPELTLLRSSFTAAEVCVLASDITEYVRDVQ